MIFQILGGIVVIGATTLLGLHFASLGARRAKDLMEMKKSLIMLKSQMDFAIYTMPQSFLHVSRRVSPPFSAFYAQLSKRLEDGEVSICDAWEQGVEMLSKGYLHREDLENIAALATTLGAMDVDVQLNSIDMLIANIDDTLAKLGTQNPKDARMYRGLGIISGLLITIVLM